MSKFAPFTPFANLSVCFHSTAFTFEVKIIVSTRAKLEYFSSWKPGITAVVTLSADTFFREKSILKAACRTQYMVVDVGLLSVGLLAVGLRVAAVGLLAVALRLPVQLLNGVHRRNYNLTVGVHRLHPCQLGPGGGGDRHLIRILLLRNAGDREKGATVYILL